MSAGRWLSSSTVLLGLAGFMMYAPTAGAQTVRRLALGPGLGMHSYSDDRFRSAAGFTLVSRFGLTAESHDGWSFGPSLGVGWQRTDVRNPTAAGRVRIGRVQTFPILAGVGGSYRRGPFEWGFGLEAGPVFHRYRADSLANAARMRTSLGVEPNLTAWYDAGRRVGLHAGLGYLVDHARVTPWPGSSIAPQRWNAGQLDFTLGVAFGIL